MSDFNTLRQSIIALIKTNGNEEITGTVLQSVLLTMIDQFDYLVAGIYDVSYEVPLQTGYYTATTARLAVPLDMRKKGMVISFNTSSTAYSIQEFYQGEISEWTTSGNWRDNTSKILNELGNIQSKFNEVYTQISNVNSINLWIPKNAQKTKAAIVSAYTTPAKNWAAMALDDGYIYINDGLGALADNWVNSGQKKFPNDVMTKSEFGDLSNISFEETSNILDKSKEIAGKYINSSGYIDDADTVFAATLPFLWGDNTIATFGKNGIAINIFTAAQYDSSGNFIYGSFINYSIPTHQINKVVGAISFRASYVSNSINQINYGDKILNYIPYGRKAIKNKDNSFVSFKPDLQDADLMKILKTGGESEVIVQPAKIYTVCGDLAWAPNGFHTRNNAACLYIDHFLKLSEKKSIIFDSTKSDKLPIYSPIAQDNSSYNEGVNVLTRTITEKIVGQIIPIDLSITHISTKASATQSAFPKVLCIGDSVTDRFLADIPYSDTNNNPTAYWSWVKKFFYLDFLDATTGHNCLMVGKQSSREFIVNGQTIRSFAEGRGGWTARNYLYDTYAPYSDNYFYDASKTGVKFSLAKYLSNHKTLADDGVTRLVVGSTAGALVTDVMAHDVCTPTHVVIQLGFNDSQANWEVDVPLMIASIKAEFPNMIIIISTIDAAGSYFPELYPEFDAKKIDLLNNELHEKMWHLASSAKALENVGNKIFYCPNYFVQPTAWAKAFRNVDFPESLANPRFIFKTEHGAGNYYHPNNYAHAAWGYQLYSLIKYTLTL